MAGHSWRSLLFGVEGWRHFLKSGYAARAKHFDDAPFARDLRGTHVVVTGANQGIGFQVAKQLAMQRASVHMVCRSEERGEKALRALKEEVAAANADGSPPDVTLDVCDVSDAKAVRAFARAYVESGRPLHCLVNNAGCMVHERTLTPEGVETNFATNTLGTYALTEGLLPSLERTAAREKTHARVIAVSSAGMLTEKLESRDVEASTSKSFDGTRQYAKGKRHQVALTERWARLAVAKCGGVGPPADGSGAVGFYAMHPGWCDTDAVKVALPGFYERLKGKLRSPREGADTAAWLCVAPAETLVSGEFYLDRAVVPKHVWSGSWFGTTYSDAEVDALAEKLEARLREALSARR